MLNELHDALIGAGQPGDAATVLEDEFRLWMKQVTRLTPPRGFGTDAKKQGEDAIKRDLSKIFTPVNEELLNDIGSQFGVDGIDQWITGSKGDKLHLVWDKIDPTGKGIQDFHRAHQDNRGRVRKGLKGTAVNVWRALYVVSFADFAAYLNKILSHVGRRKAPWAMAYSRLGGAVQNWIARHFGASVDGAFLNDISNQTNPSITAWNWAPGIRDDERILRDSKRIRTEAMKRRLTLILSGYSKDVASRMKITRKAHKQAPSADEE